MSEDKIELYSRTIELYQGRDSEADRNDLVTIYVNRGNNYMEMGRINEGLSDFTKAISLLAIMVKENSAAYNHELAETHNLRGLGYIHGKKNSWNALKDFNASAEIYEMLVGGGNTELREKLANSYMNRALVFLNDEKYQKAVDNYDKAIGSYSALIESGLTVEENNVATCYMSRGLAKISMKKFQDAVEDLTRAIEIQEKLSEKGEILSLNGMAMSYRARFMAYTYLGKPVEAEKDIKKTEELLSRLSNS